LGTDGHLYTGILISNKAHNLFLDTAVSVGLLGLVVYTFLLGFCLCQTGKTLFWGIEAVAVAYLVYTLTWYESAQFSHLTWWSLSIGLSNLNERLLKITNNH
jgi:O-antigen ligase